MGSSPVILTPDQRLRVFISATADELSDERKAAEEAVATLHMIPLRCDWIGASSRSIAESYIAQSHILLAIYGASYGWVPPGAESSVIEDEYQLAVSLPKLIYVKEAGTRDPELDSFLHRITSQDVLVKQFRDPADLSVMIQDDLVVALTERFQMAEAAPEIHARAEEPPPKRQAPPTQPTSFVGREREVADVIDQIRSPEVRLLTLTGPGGIGKTRIAFEVAERVMNGFRDGMRYVLLGTLTDPQLAIAEIAAGFDVYETHERTVAENLREFLRSRELLLVLDNFEQLIPGAPVIADLLEASAGLKVLVTSRSALLIRGEHEFPIPPLELPTARVSISDVENTDAVKLFVNRATATNPSFVLTEDNVEHVVEICAQLDGLPLAIELAAARTKLLTPEAMLKRLTDRLQLLTGGPVDLPERQRTLRATLDWDYDLLSEEEQKVFRRLGVFVGGFTLAAADAITAIDDTPLDTLTIVESLATKSLIRPVGEDGDRFRMLSTIREYAAEKLEASEDRDRVHERHIAYMLALAEESRPHLYMDDQIRWLKVLEDEHDNFRIALDWVAMHADPETELRLAGALSAFWEFRAYLSEGQRRLEEALNRGRDAPPELRAVCLQGAGILARGQGEYKRATSRIQEAVAAFRAAGDVAGEADATKQLGIIASERSDLTEARRLYTESMTLMEQIGDEVGVARARNNLGVIARDEGDLRTAAEHYAHALEVFRKAGDRQAIARILMNLGEAKLEQGELRDAHGLLVESIHLALEIGSRWDIADLLEVMAAIATGYDHPHEAAVIFGAAEYLREYLGAPLPPAEKIFYDRRVESLTARLSPADLTTGWAKGRRFTLDQAVAYALTSFEPS
ncbi:MAG: tetratricopeptide repeat protein [Actinomycetota bacterium]